MYSDGSITTFEILFFVYLMGRYLIEVIYDIIMKYSYEDIYLDLVVDNIMYGWIVFLLLIYFNGIDFRIILEIKYLFLVIAFLLFLIVFLLIYKKINKKKEQKKSIKKVGMISLIIFFTALLFVR